MLYAWGRPGSHRAWLRVLLRMRCAAMLLGLLWNHLQPCLTRQRHTMPQAPTGIPGHGRGWWVTHMLVT